MPSPHGSLSTTTGWTSTGKTLPANRVRPSSRVVVLTVDLNSNSNRVPLGQFIRADERDCSACHDPSREDSWLDRKPMYQGTDATSAEFPTPEMTWDYIGRLKSITDMKHQYKILRDEHRSSYN